MVSHSLLPSAVAFKTSTCTLKEKIWSKTQLSMLLLPLLTTPHVLTSSPTPPKSNALPPPHSCARTMMLALMTVSGPSAASTLINKSPIWEDTVSHQTSPEAKFNQDATLLRVSENGKAFCYIPYVGS